MRKTLLSMLALIAVTLSAGFSAAQESKPLAVLSLSGYDGLLRDLGEIGKIAERPGLSAMADAMVKMVTQGQGLVGVDQKQPWGAVVETDGAGFAIYAFLPSGEPKKFLDVIKPLVEDIQPQGGGYVIKANGQTIFLRSKGNWSYLSINPAWLEKAAADPSKLLGLLPQKYVAALSLRIENVPKMYRDLLLGQLQMGMQMSMQQPAPGEDAAALAARKAMAENALKQLTQALDDLAHLTLGINVDGAAKKLGIELTVAAKSGTAMAQNLAAGGQYQTQFSGLLPADAAFRLAAGGKMSAGDIETQAQTLETVRGQVASKIDEQTELNDTQRGKLKQIVSDVFDVLVQTTKGGRGDTAASLALDSKAAALLVATHVVGGAKFDKIVKDFADLVIAKEPAAAELIKLNAETHQGVRFHTVSVPIPADAENREKVVAVLGETVNIVLGTSDGAVYLAVGRDAAARLKAAIDKSKSGSSSALPPAQLSLALGRVLTFITALEPKAAADLGPVPQMLAQCGGKDHVNLTTTVADNSAVVRLEIEEGIIKLLGLVPFLGGP